ncbi:hypothetical protein BOTBODRAFT_366088 [Botryobasidium botryosum FD-172 SS1]|uniref:Uncharacterized protein n=1 Tax=Botryobasidium botryosum (strain FD-172 SS1) TaxID=930990 RepID=A0A067MG69_BOTB1|nr:hypothetical protein BOTBODRAFT_366088 [Botryobasidium botryosum FD-172 SS1]
MFAYCHQIFLFLYVCFLFVLSVFGRVLSFVLLWCISSLLGFEQRAQPSVNVDPTVLRSPNSLITFFQGPEIETATFLSYIAGPLSATAPATPIAVTCPPSSPVTGVPLAPPYQKTPPASTSRDVFLSSVPTARKRAGNAVARGSPKRMRDISPFQSANHSPSTSAASSSRIFWNHRVAPPSGPLTTLKALPGSPRETAVHVPRDNTGRTATPSLPVRSPTFPARFIPGFLSTLSTLQRRAGVSTPVPSADGASPRTKEVRAGREKKLSWPYGLDPYLSHVSRAVPLSSHSPEEPSESPVEEPLRDTNDSISPSDQHASSNSVAQIEEPTTPTPTTPTTPTPFIPSISVTPAESLQPPVELSFSRAPTPTGLSALVNALSLDSASDISAEDMDMLDADDIMELDLPQREDAMDIGIPVTPMGVRFEYWNMNAVV